jgi:hypothetical protein
LIYEAGVEMKKFQNKSIAGNVSILAGSLLFVLTTESKASNLNEGQLLGVVLAAVGSGLYILSPVHMYKAGDLLQAASNKIKRKKQRHLLQ